MNQLVSRFAPLMRWPLETLQAIDRFWFTPRRPHVLAILRVVTGVMLLYWHLALATDLSSFIGRDAWIDNETVRGLHDGAYGYSDWGRSYLWHFESPALIMLHHGFTLVVMACFTIGLLTRFTAPLAWFLQIMYVHRLTGTLFGFDQIVIYSTMYLMLTRCGSLYSVDSWLRNRWLGDDGSIATKWAQRPRRLSLVRWLLPDAQPTIAANVATRLFQIHLCIIYFFGGIAKAQGTTWWDGTAMWYVVSNHEYQSLDMTWLVRFPRLSSFLANLTLFWELAYAFLVWPKTTRPVILTLAIVMHAGIALALGMITFGIMMIGANLIFLPTSFFCGKPTEDEDKREDESLDDFELAIDLDEEMDLTSSSLSGLSSSSLSGIELDDLENRAQRIARREQRIREANDKINGRAAKLKEREKKYRDRVARLKKREAKIKEAVDRAKSRRRK